MTKALDAFSYPSVDVDHYVLAFESGNVKFRYSTDVAIQIVSPLDTEELLAELISLADSKQIMLVIDGVNLAEHLQHRFTLLSEEMVGYADLFVRPPLDEILQ